MRTRITLALLLFFSVCAFSQEKVWQQNFPGSAKYYTLEDMALSTDSAHLLLAITDEVGRIKVTVLDTAGNQIKSNSFGRTDCSTWSYKAHEIIEFNDHYVVGLSGESSCSWNEINILILNKNLSLIDEKRIVNTTRNHLKEFWIESNSVFFSYEGWASNNPNDVLKVASIDSSFNISYNYHELDHFKDLNGKSYRGYNVKEIGDSLRMISWYDSLAVVYNFDYRTKIKDTIGFDSQYLYSLALISTVEYQNDTLYYMGGLSQYTKMVIGDSSMSNYFMRVNDTAIALLNAGSLEKEFLLPDSLKNKISYINSQSYKISDNNIALLATKKKDGAALWKSLMLVLNKESGSLNVVLLDSGRLPMYRYDNHFLVEGDFIYTGINQVESNASNLNESFTITKLKISDILSSKPNEPTHRDELKIKVYPNPTDGNIWVETNDFDQLYFSVFDQQGRVIVPKQKLTSQKISLDALSKGLYHVTFFDEADNSYKSQKILLK